MKHCIQIRKHEVGSNRSLVICIRWSNYGKYRHVGEDTICRSRA
ncbi:hypothetical protein T4B_9119 [Trichinella pseudospiralis]|uniref:Uncharacterized protein n=1 Tax=Trichinella pseudospiralis TaxID=6337 RepID=A0A0V1GBX3_TRIPS|nr:hypothetical protein T4B_9119 [Trichinella pseudospiralis]KRY95754.1 hypothetical protein T4C_4900 [Trichinella pseudospiralis]